MSKKGLIALVSAILVSLFIALPVFACYASVQGELRDSATNALWAYGAKVYIYNCNTLQSLLPGGVEFIPVAAAPTAGYGTFNTPITSPGASIPMCVEVEFNAGPSGTPGNTSKTFANRLTSTGALNSGVFFTGTGPTVVSLNNLQASPVVPAKPATGLILAGVAAVLLSGLAGYVRLRRPQPVSEK